MSSVLTVVVREGALQPTEPTNFAEGQRLSVQVLDPLPGVDPLSEEEVAEFEEALDAWNTVVGTYGDAFWDEFDQFLRENRVNFEERFDPLSLGYEHDLPSPGTEPDSPEPAPEGATGTLPDDPLSGRGVRDPKGFQA